MENLLVGCGADEVREKSRVKNESECTSPAREHSLRNVLLRRSVDEANDKTDGCFFFFFHILHS